MVRGTKRSEPVLVDAREIARILGVSLSTVRRMCAANEIPFKRIRGAVRFDPGEVLASTK
jgi:excisionase family DNA binding protein